MTDKHYHSPTNQPVFCDLIYDTKQRSEHIVDGVVPKALAYPRSREEVAALLAHADAQGQKVVLSGSGTKLGLGAPPEGVDLLLRLALMNRVIDHDYKNMTLTVEAGARLAAVQAILRERSQFLPLDSPCAERATVGGILATNSCGPRRLLYGSPRDLVLGLRAVLPNGTLIKTGGKTVKNVAGFDLAKLYIGSLGTLGVIVEVTFRLLPLPEKSATLLLLFADYESACHLVRRLMETFLAPSAVELLNPNAMKRCKSFTNSKKETWGVAVACEGFAEAVERQVKVFAALGTQFGAQHAVPLQGKEQDGFWRLVTDYLVGSDKPPFTRTKASLPISKVKDFIACVPEWAAIVAHAASGIVYIICTQDELSAENLIELRKRANELGGWLTIESASTEIKRKVPVWDTPPGGLEIMKRLRTAFDPKRTLNPGRFLPGL